MNRKLTTVVVVAVFAVSSALVLSAAGPKVAAIEMKAPTMNCPGCGMMGNMKDGADMSAKMKKAGVSEETMATHRAMMNAPLYLDSPEMLLGQADTLVLTDAQKAELAKVVADSRANAAAVLTEEQRTKLGQVPEKPMTMMEMRDQMMKKMVPMPEKMSKEEVMGDAPAK